MSVSEWLVRCLMRHGIVSIGAALMLLPLLLLPSTLIRRSAANRTHERERSSSRATCGHIDRRTSSGSAPSYQRRVGDGRRGGRPRLTWTVTAERQTDSDHTSRDPHPQSSALHSIGWTSQRTDTPIAGAQPPLHCTALRRVSRRAAAIRLRLFVRPLVACSLSADSSCLANFTTNFLPPSRGTC